MDHVCSRENCRYANAGIVRFTTTHEYRLIAKGRFPSPTRHSAPCRSPVKAADRCAPLGPHQPVEAVARAEVRAGALPVLDDPREAGLRERRPDRSCRDLVGHDGLAAAVSFAIHGTVSKVAGPVCNLGYLSFESSEAVRFRSSSTKRFCIH